MTTHEVVERAVSLPRTATAGLRHPRRTFNRLRAVSEQPVGDQYRAKYGRDALKPGDLQALFADAPAPVRKAPYLG